MKVVINRKYGGFGLSDKAVEACVVLGMTVGDDDGDFKGKDFIRISASCWKTKYANGRDDNRFRCDLRLVQVVEQLGDEANGDCAKLKIVEIPFDTIDGWEIHNHDGMERIEASHSSWY
jgi:hypothetical protein